MKAEEQRIAIAAAVGTHTVEYDVPDPTNPTDKRGVLVTDRNGNQSFNWHLPPASGIWKDVGFEEVPKYTDSLDAMHEAEKIAFTSGDQWELYAANLEDACGITEMEEDATDPIFSNATQRAEAFLRTLNLWTETPPAR